MSLNAYLQPASPRKRYAAAAISLGVHAVAFIALMGAPKFELPKRSDSEYKQAIEGKEDKLVWFKFNRALPSVSPPQTKAENRPVKAEAVAPQEIVSSPKNAPKRQEMVWMDAPPLPETKPLEMPNVLAVRMPRIPRNFTAPAAEQPKTARNVELPPEAPALATAVEAVKLADAPRVTKPFIAPPMRVSSKLPDIVAPLDAPQLEARVDAAAIDYKFKAPARPFTAPRGKETGAKQITLENAPAIGDAGPAAAGNELLAANSRDLNLAVVGLNPSAKNTALPSNSSPGQFSAGPKIRDGADSAGNGNGLNVPDLYVAGSKDAKPQLMAQLYAAPTSTSSLRAAAKLSGPPKVEEDAPAPEAPRSPATRVSSAPDKRFDGREVYMMAIQMPNLTSYSGSWLMWYSDRAVRVTGQGPVAPPIAHRKVDPKYVASAASEHIEGKIQLACVIGRDGRVSTIELVRGLDDRLNQSAEEALAKWQFTPATRKGEPVEVDVLVEIPFHLAPRTQVPY